MGKGQPGPLLGPRRRATLYPLGWCPVAKEAPACPNPSWRSSTRTSAAGCWPGGTWAAWPSRTEVTDPTDLARLRALPLYPWAPGDRTRYVRVRPLKVTGRRIRIPDDLPFTWWG